MFNNVKKPYLCKDAIIIAGKKIRELFDNFSNAGKIKIMKDCDNIIGCVFHVLFQTNNLNESSIITWNKKIILTGDAKYKVIKKFHN